MKKLVKEHIIFEKFTEDSDPIHDLGIGMIRKDLLLIDLNETRSITSESASKYYFGTEKYDNEAYLIFRIIYNLYQKNDFNRDTAKKVCNHYFEKLDLLSLNINKVLDILNNRYNFGFYYGKNITESLNEKFTNNDSDPIKDLGIGTKFLIKSWLEKYNIQNYIINNDLTIDVNREVDIRNINIVSLPEYIKFRNIKNGYFSLKACGLITLRGFPISVDRVNSAFNGDFDIEYNELTSLEFCPKFVSGNFYCRYNKRDFSVEEVLNYCQVIGRIYV